ncbi:hypothetical protein TWF225_010704 [Orbilia oligospora]|nr:hypothetical protein TWF225_010704 [Orbilia oligospora]KAF3240620.1 hypothetical protein TWF128_011235 [Orbilia oligospora]KAF3243680.1 hypothetical protein TWF217_011189 [Orbilia oligospora]KAF3281861.1 hypothetical protein TWF132_011083 [Orbilia oligospora]
MSGCACNRDILLFFDQKLPGLSFFSWYSIEVCDFCEWDDIIRIVYCNSHAPRYPSKYLHYEQTEPDRSEKCACGSHQKTWRFPLEEDLQLEDNKGTNPDLVVPWDTANLDIQPSYTKAISATFKQYATASKVREINEALLKRDNSLLLDQTSFHQIFPEGERNIGLWFKLCFFVKGTPISDTLTILHISGDVLALPSCKEERSKNVVKVLNLLFENLCQLRSLSWREIGPCNEYAFYDLAEAPKYLRNFQLLQKQSDLSSKGYTKMTANYGDSLPERYLDICERFWKIIQSNFLDLFHVSIMCGPRYQCKIMERRESAGFVGYRGLHQIERIHWACEWYWRRNTGVPTLENPIEASIVHCEWERDGVTGEILGLCDNSILV